MIDQYVKEYAKGITVYNNPYTVEYDYGYSPCERMYKYGGHGHPLSIVVRLLCEDDIKIADKELKHIINNVRETPNKDIADIRHIIQYFHRDVNVAKHIRRPSNFDLMLEILTKKHIGLESTTTHYKVS